MLFERGQRQIWLVWLYLGSFFGPWKCGTIYLDANKEGGHDINIPMEISDHNDPLLLFFSMDNNKSG